MMSVSSVLMAPVRGIVWLVKLPFVLVWTLLRYIGSGICKAVAAILSVPAYYLGRARNRLGLMWAWTRGSASKLRLSLPFASNCSNALPRGSLKALPPPKNEYNTYYLYPEEAGPYAPPTKEGGSSSRRRRHSDRKHRKAIAEALTKILLEPCSPSDSDEDEAAAMRSAQPEEVEERAVKLIMDLLKLSKSEGDPQINPRVTSQDLQALREHARNKQQLESLIAEVDQMAGDVDPSLLLGKRQKQSSQLSPQSSAGLDQHQPTRRHKTHRSSTSHAKKTSKVIRDTYPVDEEEKEREAEEGEGLEEEYQYTAAAALHHRHKYVAVSDLSPVQESPEYKPEEINYQELEKDLNLALLRLNSEISELQVDPEDLTKETQITHTVTVTSTQQPSEEEEDSLFQDSREEFPTVPKMHPSLGLKAGHDRRDVAAARKPRPPTRKITATEQQGNGRDRNWQVGKWDKQDDPLSDEDNWDEEDSDLSDQDGSSGSEGEGEVPSRYKRKQRPRKLGGGIELSDQLRLLSPTSKSRVLTENSEWNASSISADSADVACLYATVNKKKKSGEQDRRRTGSDPTPTTSGHSGMTSRGSSHSMTSDLGDRELEDSLKGKSSQLLPSNQPPWIEMRFHKTSESSTQPSPTPFSATSQPPWIEMRSHKNSSGHSSSASTPTTNNAPASLHHPQPTPLVAPQSTHTAPHNTHDSSHRIFPSKPAIPRPDPPSSSSGSEPLLRVYSTEDEEEEEKNAIEREDSNENFYDTLQPKEETPQRESRIFPLHECRPERPKYLHEAITDSQREEVSSVSTRGRRGGSLRLKDPSLPQPPRNSTPKLKRTSSADTVRKMGKSREHSKQRHASSSSERRSSDGHRQRHRSSSGERTPSQRSSDRHRSSEKRGSSSSTKSSPSPKESTGTLSTMWKLLATPTSSRRRLSSSGGKEKDTTASKKSGERSSSNSPKRDDSPSSAGSKEKRSTSKADKK